MSAICVARDAHALVAGVAPRRWSGLGVAAAIAVGLHVALFVVRPGGLVRDHVERNATTMAVRMVRPPAAPPWPAVPVESRAGPTAEQTPQLDASAAQSRPATAVPSVADASVQKRAGSPTGPTVPRPPQDSREPTSSENLQRTPAAGPSLPAAPEYALGIRLDPGPRPLEDIEPEYPDPYLREGTVVLRLLISETGHVDNVAVVRSQPPGVFDEAALEAFGKAKFAPGMAAGTPVKSQITVEVQFMPINRGARVSGRTY